MEELSDFQLVIFKNFRKLESLLSVSFLILGTKASASWKRTCLLCKCFNKKFSYCENALH